MATQDKPQKTDAPKKGDKKNDPKKSPAKKPASSTNKK